MVLLLFVGLLVFGEGEVVFDLCKEVALAQIVHSKGFKVYTNYKYVYFKQAMPSRLSYLTRMSLKR